LRGFPIYTWIPIAISLFALVGTGLAIAFMAALAKRSPPGIVARAAGQLEAIEADVDARVRKLTTQFAALEIHVEDVLVETEKAASDALKRNRGARRSQQAVEAAEQAAAAANGGAATTSFAQIPVGAPGRIAAIEEAARRDRW